MQSRNLSLAFEKMTKGPPACYDYQHKPNHHDFIGPRYVSPTTGKCRRLKVQSTNPVRTEEVSVTDRTREALKLSVWLVQHSPLEPLWVLKWLWFILCLFWPFDGDTGTYTGYYKLYAMEFWGQLWAARSEKEYSTRSKTLKEHEMELPNGVRRDVKTITRASAPRQLIVYDAKRDEWCECVDKDVLIATKYLAVSYRQTDFPDRLDLELKVQAACHEYKLKAYWLDFACTGDSQADKNLDLYRIADVFRGADKTLIMISDNIPSFPSDGRPATTPTPNAPPSDILTPGVHLTDLSPAELPHSPGWLSWGDRVWTLPEALLSPALLYKVGDGPIRPISLRQVANFAYSEGDEEMLIIDGYSGKDPLERIERLSLLKRAIWKRGRGPASGDHPVQPSTPPHSNSEKAHLTGYTAERVYALMGFFEHRIMPDSKESELQALARLSMANDADRIAERMVAMLPTDILDSACWYSDNDRFGTNLWDIEPDVQVAGITQSGALVLDGCRAAAIRWKGFPAVAYAAKPSFKRSCAGGLPYFFGFLIVVGIASVAASPAGGGILIALGFLALLFAPQLLAYSNSGRITDVQPWLIGVKGVMTAKEVSARLYGRELLDPNSSRIEYSPTGTPLAVPDELEMRRGNRELSEANAHQVEYQLRLNNAPESVYTIVDTLSSTVYHFVARRPPTVCVFVGREGGLGRFVLCSDTCNLNELHKESVLRMPTYITRSMRSCGWLAIGGAYTDKSEQISSVPVGAEVNGATLDVDTKACAVEQVPAGIDCFSGPVATGALLVSCDAAVEHDSPSSPTPSDSLEE